MNEDEFFPLHKAAEYCGVSKSTLRYWRKKEKIPEPKGIRKGYWKSQLDQFLAKPASSQSANA